MADEKWHFAKREGGEVLIVDGVECDMLECSVQLLMILMSAVAIDIVIS